MLVELYILVYNRVIGWELRKKMDEKQLLLKVPDDFKKWLKTKSVQMNRPMKEIVVEAVEQYLKRYEK